MKNSRLEDCIKWAIDNDFKLANPRSINSSIDDEKNQSRIASFSLNPLIININDFNKVWSIQTIFNELIYKMSLDKDSIINKLSHLFTSDPSFSGKLLDIYKRITDKSPIKMAIHRSDYIMDTEREELINVEVNTFSCAFPSLSQKIVKMHSELNMDTSMNSNININTNIIPNNSLDKMVDSFNIVMEKRLLLFFASNNINHKTTMIEEKINNHHNVNNVNGTAIGNIEMTRMKKTILMIVKNDESNIYDQELMINLLKHKHDINVIRATLRQVHEDSIIDKENGNLYFKNQLIGIVYFRAGYAPSDYPSHLEWSARELIESSAAVKCPSIGVQLAGFKHFQYEWQNRNYLRQFLRDDQIDLVYPHFTQIRLILNETDKKDIFNHADDHVLKPQREGGGNNLYNDQIKEFLLNDGTTLEELRNYICMKKIRAHVEKNQMLYSSSSLKEKEDSIIETDTISELGIYGVWASVTTTITTTTNADTTSTANGTIITITDNQNGNRKKGGNDIITTTATTTILINEPCGYLVRTKPANQNEGGVMIGASHLNSAGYLS